MSFRSNKFKAKNSISLMLLQTVFHLSNHNHPSLIYVSKQEHLSMGCSLYVRLVCIGHSHGINQAAQWLVLPSRPLGKSYGKGHWKNNATGMMNFKHSHFHGIAINHRYLCYQLTLNIDIHGLTLLSDLYSCFLPKSKIKHI